MKAKAASGEWVWAYWSCLEDDVTCSACLESARELEHVAVDDPRLIKLRGGHPRCTSPAACRCSVVLVGHED